MRDTSVDPQARRSALVVVLLLLFGATVGIAFQHVKLTDSQEDERGGFEIDVEFPSNTTLEETEEWFAKVEKIMEEKQEELDLEGYIVIHRATWGELEGWFNSPRTSKLKPREATKAVLDLLPMKPC